MNRVLVLAAHPDDETIGCAGLLGRTADAFVAHLTDGAPRDTRFIPARFAGDRSAYRRARREEVLHALSLVGIGEERIIEAGAPDQEASYELASLVRWWIELCRRLRPDVVVVHPYEGGHPDHDAAAFVARIGGTLLQQSDGRAPTHVEMTSYHAPESRLVTGHFLGEGHDSVEFRLTERERARKSRMMRLFATQEETLSLFSIDHERFRRAPEYDFGAAPHGGALYYEQLGWALTGRAWRELAQRAWRDLAGDLA